MILNILLSIQRIHCRRILSGDKVIEIRKTCPNGDIPFRIFIYETKSDHGAGAVVGECTCYYITAPQFMPSSPIIVGSCLLYEQILNYAKGKPFYGWYVADVIKYDAPRPLSSFGIERAPQSWCYLKQENKIPQSNEEKLKKDHYPDDITHGERDTVR